MEMLKDTRNPCVFGRGPLSFVSFIMRVFEKDVSAGVGWPTGVQNPQVLCSSSRWAFHNAQSLQAGVKRADFVWWKNSIWDVYSSLSIRPTFNLWHLMEICSTTPAGGRTWCEWVQENHSNECGLLWWKIKQRGCVQRSKPDLRLYSNSKDNGGEDQCVTARSGAFRQVVISLSNWILQEKS